MIERNEVIQYLNKNISLAFDNQSFLINKFFSRYEENRPTDILNIYISDINVSISILMWSGETFLELIPTSEFLDWCEEMEK